MKKRLDVKNRLAALTASTLLLSSVMVSSGWAQNRPSRAPKKPVERETPVIRTPIDPRIPILVNPPVIKSPTASSGVDIKKPLVVSGTSIEGAHLHVTVSGEWKMQVGGKDRTTKNSLGNVITYADSRGNWQTEAIRLRIPEQAKDVRIQISAVQTVSGRGSSPAVVTVRPLMTVMLLEPPVIQATIAPMLYVTTPKDGSKIPAKDKRLFLEGTAIGGQTVSVQMTMEVYMTNGNWFTGGEKRTKRQIHRRVDNVPVKNGKWSTYIDITPQKGDKGITKTTFDIVVSLQGQWVDKRISLTQ